MMARRAPIMLIKRAWSVRCAVSITRFAPKIHKCTFCADRLEANLEPACATVCPTGAISFGDRDDMVAEAKRRIAAAPGTYIPEIYGLEEVGGTSVLHLSSVPFEQIGYITGLPKTPMPDLTHRWLRVTPHVFGLLYAVFGALTWIMHRRHSKEKHEKGATA